MKITRLKLVGAIGIKHGLDRDEIEIKFGDNKLTMLSGGNGSGKTTILSQLHPFKSTFDDRRTAIIDGGVKEIDIEHDGNLYEIIHYYGPKAKSFIQKNGVELNANGGVRTFEQIVEDELGVNSDYFKIGKIGSNTQNFIDFTTAERKTYISKLLPDIDKYLKSSEVVRKKFNKLSDSIKRIASDINKYSNEEVLETQIKELENSLNTVKESIVDLTANVLFNTNKINELNSLIAHIDQKETIQAIKEHRELIEQMENSVTEFLSKYGEKDIEELEGLLEKDTPEYNRLKTEFEVLRSFIAERKVQIQDLHNELNNLALRLEGMESAEDINKLKEDLKEKEKKSKEIKVELSKFEDFKLSQNITEDLSRLRSMGLFISENFASLNEEILIPAITDTPVKGFELIQINGVSTTLKNLLADLTEENRGLLSELAKAEVELNTKKRRLKSSEYYTEERKEEYKARFPGIDETKMYADAFGHLDVLSDIQELEEIIPKLKERIGEIEALNELYTDLVRIEQEFKFKLGNFEGTLGDSLIRRDYGGFRALVGKPKGEIERIISDISSQLDMVIHLTDNLEQLDLEIYRLTSKISTIENSSQLQKEIEGNIEAKKKQIKNLTDSVNAKADEYREYKEKISELSERINDYKLHLKYKKEYNTIQDNMKKLIEKEELHTNTMKEIYRLQAELNTQNNILNNQLRPQEVKLNNDLLSAKVSLSEVKNLKKQLEELDSDYKDIELVRNALDPNKGIPLIFIQSYLEKTKSIANELLAEAFKDDKFEIDFLAGERDFFIRVRSGDNIKNDISEASQGEVALTTISISLALIEQSIGDYNILMLDEIDGPLDRSNRENFLNIITKQIDRLGIEQVFVISHNDAFDTEEMDLILLKGNNTDVKAASFFNNKKVIFDSSKD